jgi:hypothetical protein
LRNFGPIESRKTLRNFFKGKISFHQDWYLVINKEKNIKMIIDGILNSNPEEQKELDIRSFDDIIKLPYLLKTVPLGFKGIDNHNTYLSTSGFDPHENLPLRTTWNVINPVSSSLSFEAKLLSSRTITHLEVEFILTNEIQPRVLIHSKDISLGEFTVPSNGVLIVNNLPLTSVSNLKITVTDHSMYIKSVTLSGLAYHEPTFLTQQFENKKDNVR